MISEGFFILLIVLAVTSAYATFLYNIPSYIGGPFSAILFALVALYSDAVYSNIGVAGTVFNYAPVKIFAAVCCVIMVFGVLLDIMTTNPFKTGEGP